VKTVPYEDLIVRVVEDRPTDWAAWIAAGVSIITLLVVVAGLWVAYRGLRDARQMRHAQLIAELTARWDDRSLAESSLLFREYGPKKTVELVDALWTPGLPPEERSLEDLRDWYVLSVYPNLVETFGVLTKQKLLTGDVVFELWSSSIIELWDEWQEAVRRLREHSDMPNSGRTSSVSLKI
jgi:hypothetical protein